MRELRRLGAMAAGATLIFLGACLDFDQAVLDCQTAGGCTDGLPAADAGAGEDGGSDAGSTASDAGFDAGQVDAGFDAGVEDAGFDAGVVDAGWCGGKWCQWASTSSEGFETNKGMFATSPNTGYGVSWGTRVWRSNGTTFTPQTLPNAFQALYAIWGHGNTLITGGDNGAWYTHDGLKWTEGTSPSGYPGFQDIHGLSDGGSIHAGARGPKVLRLEDGGWSEVWSGGDTYSSEMWGIWVISENDIWAVGDDGVVVHWDGSQWATDHGPPNVTDHLTAVWASGPNDVWIVGRYGAAYHWDGSTWTTRAYPGVNFLWDVWGSPAGEVYAVGSSGTLVHWSGDAGWTQIATNETEALLGIWGSGENDLFIVRHPGSDPGGEFLHFRR